MSYLLRPLSAQDRVAWLRLIRSENIGPVIFKQLLARYGDAASALEAVPELARRGGKRSIRLCSLESAEKELDAADRIGATAITACEAEYPPILAQLPDPPPLIYTMGQVDLLQKPAIGMVGARNASASGRRFAAALAGELSKAGLAVVSGLARGIDTAAHQGSLPHGTVAVMAGGLDKIYPPENEELFNDIVEQGVALSERPPGTTPKGRDFPRRNRLISGLSYGVIVVEAAMRSGSLITARLAGEQGREVFAVPGSPVDPRASGTNNLLRQGATLVERAEDVISVLTPMLGAPMRQIADSATQAYEYDDQVESDGSGGSLSENSEQDLVFSLLSPAPVEIDHLLRQARLTPGRLMPILLELELAGRIDRHAGNKVSIS